MEEKDQLRFWGWVLRTDEKSCWHFLGHCDAKNGYGYFSLGGKMLKAHRVAYELIKGQIPKGFDIDHLCRVKDCCNPDHLEAVTHKTNILRGLSPFANHARKTHCIHGHPFDEENTYIRNRNNHRLCRECHRIQGRKNYWRHKK